MTILHIMPDVSRGFGGPTESLISYAGAAEGAGVKTEVASPACSADDLSWLKEQLPETTFHQFKSYGRHAWVVSRGLWTWLKRHGGRYDVIHIHGLFNPVSSRSAGICRRHNYSYVIRPFGTLSRYTFSRTGWFKKPWFYFIDRPNIRGADGVHFTTRAEFKEADRLPLELEHKEWVIPPPYRPEGAPGQTNSVNYDHPVCLYMSRLHPKKNIEGLLKAWHKVQKEFDNARLLIAGSGEEGYVSSLKDMVSELQLDDSVTFKGFVSGKEKEELLQKSWMFALPSHQENFGVAVLEASAAGLPVVISPEVQICDFVKSSNTGIVTSRDPHDIAEGISELFRNEAFRKRCSTEGPAAVSKKFSLERVGKELLDMYESI